MAIGLYGTDNGSALSPSSFSQLYYEDPSVRANGGDLWQAINPADIKDAYAPGGRTYYTEAGNNNAMQVRAYDTDKYSSPELAYLDNYSDGKWGTSTRGLADIVTKNGWDPRTLIDSYRGTNPDTSWSSGPLGFLSAASQTYGGPNAASLSSFLGNNQGGLSGEQSASNAQWQNEHPAMSMHGTDYMQILQGIASVIGAGYGAGAFADVGAGAGAGGWTSGYDLAGGGALDGAGAAGAGWTPDEWTQMGQLGQGGGVGAGGGAGGAAVGEGGATNFIPQIANAADPIEALNAAMQATGTSTAGDAAMALGYASPEEMIGAINPEWLSGAGPMAVGGALEGGGGGGQPAVAGGQGNVAPSTAPTASAPSPAGAASNTKDLTLQQILSKLGNGTNMQDVFGAVRANPMSLMSLGGGGPVSNGLNMASSLYGMYNSKKTSDLAKKYAEQADPFASQRKGYADQLAALMANPSSLVNTPGYTAGLDAITRKMAANGYLGSGNMMSELSNYGSTAFNQQAQMLANLAGAGANPAAAGQIALSGANAGNDMMSKALAALGYGTRLFGI